MPAHDERSSPKALLKQLDALIASVRDEAQTQRHAWPGVCEDFEPSALNLAAWLALRRRDLGPMRQSLMALGLSPLEHLEGRVLEALSAVRASLAAIAHEPVGTRPSTDEFFAGRERLRARSERMFGPAHPTRPVAVMIACRGEAAEDPDFLPALAGRGVQAVRIDCAYDDRNDWAQTIDRARAAGMSSGHPMRVFMDLDGPRIRTGKVSFEAGHRMQRGDHLAIAFAGSLKDAKSDFGHPAAECTLDAALQAAEAGHRIFYDNGRLGLVVQRTTHWGLVAQVETCADKGVKVKSEKILNFPDTDFVVDALTPKDLHDLDFVAVHADAVEFSFAQSADDVIKLQSALARRREDWRSLGLVLKFETAQAVARLPEILMQAASAQPTALMIARGGLAIEMGINRTGEIQEEMLRLAEAAQVPVIWETQVLEHLAGSGMPLRSEMADAAMAARAGCVMLNKIPRLCESVDALDMLLDPAVRAPMNKPLNLAR